MTDLGTGLFVTVTPLAPLPTTPITVPIQGPGIISVTTDSNGGFTVTGDYQCVSGTQVYVYAVGGNGGAGVNSGAGVLALLDEVLHRIHDFCLGAGIHPAG